MRHSLSHRKFAKLKAAKKSGRCCLRSRLESKSSGCANFFPKRFEKKRSSRFDATQRRVIGRRETRFHDLVLRSNIATDVSKESAARLLAREVFDKTLTLKNWDNSVEQWIARVNFVAAHFPEMEFPRIGDAEKLSLLEQICHGAHSYREIKERAVWPVVKSWLSPAQQEALDHLAPERIKLPGGRSVKVSYSESSTPTVSARIQDLYGLEKNLTIARGKIPLRIQVLAPSNRPLQITDDLENFWRETYPKIKKELQRKYPKHEWR